MVQEIFYPKFLGINSGAGAIDKNHASDCMNWVTTNNKLGQHGPRLASKALVTSPFQDSNGGNAEIRLMPQWIDSAGNRQEFRVLRDGTDGNYEGVYEREDAGHELTANVERPWGGPTDFQIVTSATPKTFIGGTKYFWTNTEEADGFFTTTSAVSGVGVASYSSVTDQEYYRSIEWPNSIDFITVNFSHTFEIGFRISYDGSDVSLGSRAFVNGVAQTFNTGSSSTFGRCGTEARYTWWFVPSGDIIILDNTRDFYSLNATGNFKFVG